MNAQNTGGVNKANVIGWIIIAACAGAAAWWYVGRETPTVPVSDWHGTSGTYALEGTVEPPLDAVNRALRAMNYGSIELDFFEFRDDSGVVRVYFNPSTLERPQAGTQLWVVGRNVEESGTGNRRFMGSTVGPVPAAPAQ